MLKGYHPQHMSGFKREKGSSEHMVPVLSDPLKCKCNLNAKTVVVKKEGQNQGKTFWACFLPQAKQCKFFKWKDEAQTCQLEQKTSNKKIKSENTVPYKLTRILALFSTFPLFPIFFHYFSLFPQLFLNIFLFFF